MDQKYTMIPTELIDRYDNDPARLNAIIIIHRYYLHRNFGIEEISCITSLREPFLKEFFFELIEQDLIQKSKKSKFGKQQFLWVVPKNSDKVTI